MVLDIRHLRKAELGVEKTEGKSKDNVETNTTADGSTAKFETELSTDLESLLSAACKGELCDRAAAVAQLRALVPSRQGNEALCNIVENKSDSRRLVAAQMLGYHRGWLSSKSGIERLVGWTRSENDPKVGRALVWALRGKPEAKEFLLHRVIGIAREAALGLPLSKETVPDLVTALFVGRVPDVETILLEKLKTIHGPLSGITSALIVEWVGSIGDDEIGAVVACLPQVSMFELFLTKKGLPAWDPEADEEGTEMLRKWYQLARIVETTMLKQPSADLVRHLVNRCAREEAFARRHASFLSAAMVNTDAVFGGELLSDLERLTIEATEERLLKMAEMLLDLRGKLDGRSEPAAAELLEEWKSKSPALKLKIYHMQQGLQ